MFSQKARVSWWSRAPNAVEVCDAIELDRLIDEVIRLKCVDYPTMIEIHANGYRLEMAVGLPESFVQVSPESGGSPYFVAVSDKNTTSNDTFDFFLQGYHTEIPCRNVVPATVARALCRAFLITGNIPKSIGWDEL